jgi:signal transduction histidine kinase
MRERAAEIGGSMDLRSFPGQGTEVVVVVPRGT